MTNQQGAPEALYASAMEFAAEKASISYVQRKCRCSWNDAEQMLERMVREGIIATYNGQKSTALVEAQQPAPSAACPVGNSGFDHQTAADVLNGKTVSDEVMRKFVAASRWAHDDRAGLQATLLSVRGELASREAEIALLKKALMDAEALQPSPTPQTDSQPAPAVGYPPLPRVGAIGYASVVDIESYAKTLTIGPHLPGVRDIALWTTDQMRAYVDADRAARAPADSVTAPAGGVVAYLDIGAGGYLDLGTDLGNEALSRLPKGRHALVIAGTYGIDGYAASAPAPSGHIKEPYTVAEIKAKIASNDYSAELLLQHAMLHLDRLAASAGSEPVAWRYVDARGHFRYVGYKPSRDMAAEYPLLKPIRLYLHPSPPEGMVGGWTKASQQLPPCRDDQLYLGINTAGFAGVFNALADIAGWVHCMYEMPEETIDVMSSLDIWQPFTPPTTSAGSGKGE